MKCSDKNYKQPYALTLSTATKTTITPSPAITTNILRIKDNKKTNSIRDLYNLCNAKVSKNLIA